MPIKSIVVVSNLITAHTHRFAYWFQLPQIAAVMHKSKHAATTLQLTPLLLTYCTLCRAHVGNKAHVQRCHHIFFFTANTFHTSSISYHIYIYLPPSRFVDDGVCIDRRVSPQFDMQQLSLDELKQVLFHAFRDHLTMKDIENIIITEEESLNETSGNCPEYEGGEEAVLMET